MSGTITTMNQQQHEKGFTVGALSLQQRCQNPSALLQAFIDRANHPRRRVPAGNPNPFLFNDSNSLEQHSNALPYIVHRKLLRRRHVVLIQKRKEKALLREQNRSSLSITGQQYNHRQRSRSPEGRMPDSRRSLEIRQTIRPRNLAESHSFSDLITQEEKRHGASVQTGRSNIESLGNVYLNTNKHQRIGNMCLAFSPVRIRPSPGFLRSISAMA